MKKVDIQSDGFRRLTMEEQQEYTGGGFAYDVGRLLRFVAISGPNGQFTPMAVMDFFATRAIQ
jgi:hypothetical protein